MSYSFTAEPITRAYTGLPAVLMCEVSMRFPTSETGHGTTAPRHLMRAAWDDAGYCIDAPEMLPAGGCENLQVDDDLWAPSQLIATRETEA